MHRPDYAEANLAPKTLHRYKEILDTRILPAIGHIKIDQLRPQHIIEFENMLRENGIRKDKKEGGLSEKTILQHHRIISSILNDAVQWQVIYSSPAARVKPPKVPKKQAKCYDEEQTGALLDALEKLPPRDLKYRAMVELALTTGLRRGELGGSNGRISTFINAPSRSDRPASISREKDASLRTQRMRHRSG